MKGLKSIKCKQMC